MPKDIRFVKGKETKNTFKFDEKPESGQPPIMGNLYLPKWLLEQNGNRESRERALEHAVEQEVHQLGGGVAALGTIASIAPFVGLLGTVIGIIKAFGSIAVSNGGGAEVVSKGIAEALVTTACGLLVAIPSVAAYNYCAHKIKNLAKETDLAVYELVSWLSEAKQPPMWNGIRTNSKDADIE